MSIEKLTIYTDGSSRPVDGDTCAGWGVFIEDDKGMVKLHGCGSSGKGGTNNKAELDAMIWALRKTLELKTKAVEIYSDSMYVLKNFKGTMHHWNEKTAWLTKSGQTVSNRPEWEELIKLEADYKAAKIDVKMHWVKGHSSIKGNEEADRLARKGAELCSRGADDEWLGNVELDPKAKKPKAPKVPNVPGMLHGKFITFVTGTSEGRQLTKERLGGLTPYALSEFEDKKDEKIAGAYFGKPNAAACYSIVALKDPFSPIEDVMERQDEITPGDNQYPILINKPLLLSKKTLTEYVTSGKEMLSVNRGTLGIWGAEQVTTIRNPVLLANKAFSIFETLTERLVDYKNQKERDFFYVDITDYIFIRDEKSKLIINPDISSSDKAIKVSVPTPNGNLTVTLGFGIDMPIRNDLGRLARANKDITVKIAISDLTSTHYRHWQIFDADEGLAIYQSPHSSFKPIAAKKKKK